MTISNEYKGWSITECILIFIFTTVAMEICSFGFMALSHGAIFLLSPDLSSSLSNYIVLFARTIASILIIRYVVKKSSLKCILKQRVSKKIEVSLLFLGVLLLIGYVLTYSTSIDLLLINVPYSQAFIDAASNLVADSKYAFLSTVLFAPVFEEILHRGIILEKLSRKYNEFISILISALIFAFSHLNLVQGVNTFFLGIVISLIYIKSGSLLITILIHLINNLYFYLVMFHSNVPRVSYGNFNIYQLLVGILLLIVSLLYFYKIKNSNLPYIYYKKGD
ncbi:CPBP family intramembrane glutamic endopeptidase [Clostridium sp. UBA1652]|uniref:CPBP family intramembrane glutamic endopeptidase n=1 Tax=Clostridium sp. UBA1652 TaxID=1946348 RepID=UPI00257D7D9B|nr:CPBP family intramembrane glutamic endopeptidase [Clostridium sp. UBA1652]